MFCSMYKVLSTLDARTQLTSLTLAICCLHQRHREKYARVTLVGHLSMLDGNDSLLE